MGIPYSKQINAAFDQVTPLVAAAYEVLQTTKNISILLASIQVLTVLILLLILLTMVALLISVNPDLAHERKQLITPVVKNIAYFFPDPSRFRGLGTTLFWLGAVLTIAAVVIAYLIYFTKRAEEGGPLLFSPMSPTGPSLKMAQADMDALKRPESQDGAQDD